MKPTAHILKNPPFSSVDPRLDQRSASALENSYVQIRNRMRDEKASGKKTSIPITVRQLEAIVRIAESLARMEQNESVSEQHVEEALRLFTMSTLDAANDGGRGVLNNLSEEDRRTVLEVEATVRLELGGRRGT